MTLSRHSRNRRNALLVMGAAACLGVLPGDAAEASGSEARYVGMTKLKDGPIQMSISEGKTYKKKRKYDKHRKRWTYFPRTYMQTSSVYLSLGEVSSPVVVRCDFGRHRKVSPLVELTVIEFFGPDATGIMPTGKIVSVDLEDTDRILEFSVVPNPDGYYLYSISAASDFQMSGCSVKPVGN